MTTPSANPASVAPAKVAPAVKLMRLVLIAVILYLGWEVYHAYRAMLAGPQPAPGQPLDLPLNLPLSPAEMLVSTPGDGPWTFAGMPWKVATTQTTGDDLLAQLSKPLFSEPDLLPFPLPPTWEPLFKVMKFEKKAQGNDTLYLLNRSDLKIALFARADKGGPLLLLGAKIAAPGPGGGWQVLTATPIKSEQKVAAATTHLLPVPDAWRHLARRHDDQGRVVSEIGSLQASVADLEKLWQADGWQVRPISKVDRGTFLVCLKGDETMGAWALPGPGPNEPMMLILVRADKK